MVFDVKMNSIWSQVSCFKAQIRVNQTISNYFDINTTLLTKNGQSTMGTVTYYSLPRTPYVLVDPVLKTASLIAVNATNDIVYFLSNGKTFGYLYSKQQVLPNSTLQYYGNLTLTYTGLPNIPGIINYITNNCKLSAAEGNLVFEI
jgi:hypothetical protein